MTDHARRDFIKWVLYLGVTATLPKIASVKDVPHDVLEGISCVNKKIADLSGNAAAYRLSEDAAFEACMRDFWKKENGSIRYVRVLQDLGIQPARTEYDPETGESWERPEGYVTFFQYRRA